MSAPSPHAQPAVTVALIGVPAAGEPTLRAAFKLFSIETQSLNGNVRQALQAGPFAGCVVRLPNGEPAKVGGTIVWRHHPNLLGIRFAAGDEGGNSVRQWIDEYLRLY